MSFQIGDLYFRKARPGFTHRLTLKNTCPRRLPNVQDAKAMQENLKN
jgi:hypothetical protein